MNVSFQSRKYKLIVTEHARNRMTTRGISIDQVIELIENGIAMKKKDRNKYWVYRQGAKLEQASICLSIAVESPNVILITTMINWRPHR